MYICSLPFHFYPGYESDSSEKASLHHSFFAVSSLKTILHPSRCRSSDCLSERNLPLKKKFSPEQLLHWFIPCISFSRFLIKFSTWSWIRTLSVKTKTFNRMFRASKSPWWISDHLELFETEHPLCRWMRLNHVLCPHPKEHRPSAHHPTQPNTHWRGCYHARQGRTLPGQPGELHTLTHSHTHTHPWYTHTHTPLVKVPRIQNLVGGPDTSIEQKQ